ncbi:MAG TPA: aminotransferase class IV [Bacteroidales bacterium]|nr:aminotransferase class IV [Bacteroidales bacterium]
MRDCIGCKLIFNDQVLSKDLFNKTSFMSGIILYEVIAFYNKKYLYLEDHLQRLESSSKLARLPLWIPISEVRARLLNLLEINDIKDGSINLVFNYTNQPNTFVTYVNKPHDPSKEDYLDGIRTELHFDIRTTPNIKFFLQDFRERAGKVIREHDLWEVILVDKNDYITEASRSNVFMIKDREVITAPVELVLPGVTRKHIIEICKELHIPIREKCVTHQELKDMDAVFLTGTTSKVLPVRYVGDWEFNAAHPVLVQIREAYEQAIAKYIGIA